MSGDTIITIMGCHDRPIMGRGGGGKPLQLMIWLDSISNYVKNNVVV
jgi:hypothetical protein